MENETHKCGAIFNCDNEAANLFHSRSIGDIWLCDAHKEQLPIIIDAAQEKPDAWHKVSAQKVHTREGEYWRYSRENMPEDTRKVFIIVRFEYLYSVGDVVVRNHIHISRWNGSEWLHPYSLSMDGRVTHWCELSELKLPNGIEVLA